MESEGWLALVRRQLRTTTGELAEAHRGAYTLFSPDVHVLFGNRGDDEVLILRSVLPEAETTVLAYGESLDSHSWAMIVRGPLDAAALSEFVWTAWHAAHAADAPMEPETQMQMAIADTMVRRLCPTLICLN